MSEKLTNYSDDKVIVYHMKAPIGSNITFTDTISSTLYSAISHGMLSVQFFLDNHQSMNKKDITCSKRLLTRFPTNVVTHFSITANLAGSIKSLAWNGDKFQDYKTTKTIRDIEYELKIMSDIAPEPPKGEAHQMLTGVVIHPGSFPDKSKGILAVIQTINKINFPEGNSLLFLENSAGEGTKLASTFSEIKQIYDGVNTKKRIGICIDTCHIFASGEYDLSDTKEVQRLFDDYNNTFSGIPLIFHLNDSKKKFKSKVDRHACLGLGYIWGKSFDSLKLFLKICIEKNIPIILETEITDMLTIDTLIG